MSPLNSTAVQISLAVAGRSAKQIERAKETEHILSILHQWGIHTLGQLAALKRDDLAARLGTRAIELWERANGRAERILKLVSPPESFVESFEFENEIETVEPLLFMLRRFLQQLATRLNAIYLVAKELRLRIAFADKSHYERAFKIPQPTNNGEILFRMLYAHLENFTSQHPILAVELEAQPSRSVRQQFGLFETALRDPAQLHETLARLIGLLGASRVGTPVLEETHRPDAFRMEPFAWEIPHSERSVTKSGHPEPRKLSGDSVGFPASFATGFKAWPRRLRCSLDYARDDNARVPLRRFRKRTKATVLLKNNQPTHVRAPEIEGTTVAKNGPFPLSGNWWDEHAWAQVEWNVEIENGAVVRCHCDNNGWAIDGIYD